MKICQLLLLTIKKIESAKLPYSKPRFEAEIILSHVLKKNREFIFTYPEKKVTEKQLATINKIVKERTMGKPLAHLIGTQSFYGLSFCVNKDVLIPRPETELMIEETIKIVSNNSQSTMVIDVGTGSGCIIITLAKILNSKFYAIDISEKSLRVAKKNAKLHKVNEKILFLKGNLIEPIIKNLNFKKNKESKVVILANLPYLTKKQIENSPSIKYEPELALLAGPDGLKYYQKLFKQINELSRIKQNFSICILCEIDSTQSAKIKKIIKQEIPKTKVIIKKDLNGLDRLVIIKLK